jgi:hypothetical protein
MMNRQQILDCIHRHLRENSADSPALRPLGEIVPRVASELVAVFASSKRADVDVDEIVVPVWQVAAFIDGELESDETEAVCLALLHDNSVLAEIIGAVRDRMSMPQPLSESLEYRLLAMKPVVQDSFAGETVQKVPDVLPLEITVEETSSEQHDNGSPQSSVLRRLWDRDPVRVVVASILSAAAILAVMVLTSRWRNADSSGQYLVEKDRSARDGIVDAENRSRPNESDASPPDSRPPQENAGGRTGIAENVAPNNDDREKPRAVNDGRNTPSNVVVRQPDDAPDSDSSNTAVAQGDIDPPYVLADSLFARLRWSKISGILALSTLEKSSSSGGSSSTTWSSVPVGAIGGVGFPLSGRGLALRTLPFSRAEGGLDDGRRVILDADTSITMNGDTQDNVPVMSLHHGGIAMIGWPAGSRLNMRHGRQQWSLSWKNEGDVVLHHTEAGLQMDVHRGIIRIDNQEHANTSLVFALNRVPQIVGKPTRRPSWLRQASRTQKLADDELQQLANSRNILRSLTGRIDELSHLTDPNKKDTHTLEVLARWRAAVAGTDLLRMVGSRYVVLRLAAMERLVELPPWDPRYNATWRASDVALFTDVQRIRRIRTWCNMARRGMKISPGHLEQLLDGLQSNQLASRAMSDYLLRRFLGGGPPFDASWTGQLQSRGVNVWRKYAGRSRPQAIAPSRIAPSTAPLR